MDEATHLTRAQATWQGYPFSVLLSGKALAPYLAALFNPFFGAPFIGRYVVAAIGAVGLASAMGLGRALHSRAAGMLAGILWLLCPFLFFYERMALVDATLAAMATFSAWTAVRMMRTGNSWDAVWCGVGLALCPFAKTTGLIYLAIPVAVVVLPARLTLKMRVRQGLIAYAVAAGLAVLPALYIASQSANIFGLGDLSSTDVQSLGDRLAQNPVLILTAFDSYFTRPFLLILTFVGLIGLLMRPRRGFVPLTLLGLPVVVLIVVASDLYLRYMVIAVPGLLLLSAFGMVDLPDNIQNLQNLKARHWARLLPWVVVVATVIGWAFLFVVPFMSLAYQDPINLPLPSSDEAQYVFGWTSGYGLRDVATDLVQRAQQMGRSLTAIGMLGSCNTIRLYIPTNAPVTIECPDVWDPTGAGMAVGASEITQQIDDYGMAFVIGEENGPLGPDAIPTPHFLVKTYSRPDSSLYDVELFQVFASNGGANPGRSH